MLYTDIPPAIGEVHLVQQSPLGLTCPGDQVVYQCTLPGMTVFWRFPGGEITLIRTINEVVSGNFRAQPVGVIGGNFTSTLTFTAESGTVITCINGDRSMNDSQTVIVQGTYMHICVIFSVSYRGGGGEGAHSFRL